MTGSDQAAATVDRVGPGGSVASDSAFGVALVTLWQDVADAGGPVGFAAPVVRSEVAALAAGLVEELRTGRLLGLVVNQSRRLVAVALLRPGRNVRQHTGRIELLLVDPGHVRSGLGSQLMDGLLRLARERGLDRLEVDVQDGAGLEQFFGRYGFAEWGRRPGWVRPGSREHDEVLMGVLL